MIYHYTDLYAAKSITENAEVWLTDYRYLNDKEEFLKKHKNGSCAPRTPGLNTRSHRSRRRRKKPEAVTVARSSIG